MVNKTSKKVRVVRERFDAALKSQEMSIRKLGKNKCIDRDEKTIRRNLKTGFNADVLDRIGQVLNVDPDFLAGAYDWPLQEIDNEDIKKLYLEKRLRPENFPYRFRLQSKHDYRSTLRAVLELHGVSVSDLDQLEVKLRVQLDNDLDAAILRVLKQYFPQSLRANQYYDYGAYEPHIGDIISMFGDELTENKEINK